MTTQNATNDNDFSHQRNYDRKRTMYFQEQKHILINFRNDSPFFLLSRKFAVIIFLQKLWLVCQKKIIIVCFNNGDIK
jgi:hypothetical protein